MKGLRFMIVGCALLLPAAAAMGSVVIPTITMNMGTMTSGGLLNSIEVAPGSSFDVLVYLTSAYVAEVGSGQFKLQAGAQPDDPADYFALSAVNFASPWSNNPIDTLIPSLAQTLDAGNSQTSGLIGSMTGGDTPSANADFATLSVLVSASATPGVFSLAAVSGIFSDPDFNVDILGITGQTLSVTVVPEPGVMALMLAGTAILLRAGRSRRTRPVA